MGEYSSKIENASELISTFLDTYQDEPVQVQLQTLTAVVKLFLTRPEEAQGLVQRVLGLATKTADSADLRDRAYIQWRLLSSDTEVAKVRASKTKLFSTCHYFLLFGLLIARFLVRRTSFSLRDHQSLYQRLQFQLDYSTNSFPN